MNSSVDLSLGLQQFNVDTQGFVPSVHLLPSVMLRKAGVPFAHLLHVTVVIR